jgi:transaldolase
MILLDSAKENDALQAKQLGWVKGITTNPTLMAQAGMDPEHALARLADVRLGIVYYELVSKDEESMLAEAHKAREIVGSQLGLKLLPTRAGFHFAARYGQEFPCIITALYSPAQALVAMEAGAKWAVVYVNRATRLMGDGIGLVAAMAEVLRGSQTEILVASIKSPDEAVAAVRAGAQNLTMPLDILLAMSNHPLSDEAGRQFDENGVGLSLA